MGVLIGLLTAEQLRPVIDDRQLEGFVVAGDICIAGIACMRTTIARAHPLFPVSGCAQTPVIRPESRPVEFVACSTTAA
jgi:hypothetical protein